MFKIMKLYYDNSLSLVTRSMALQETNSRGEVKRKGVFLLKRIAKAGLVQNEKRDYGEGKEIHAKAHPNGE